MHVDLWTVKAWPAQRSKQEFKTSRNKSYDSAIDIMEHYNKQGYSIVAVLRQRGPNAHDDLES